MDTAYFAENWKHSNKIIFKCVNNAVRPIFNEKVAEKWSLWLPWIMHGTHWCALFTKEKSTTAAKRKTLKSENADAQTWIQTLTKCL